MEVLNLFNTVVNYLRNEIISAEFKPGQRLNEINISKLLNVSRPPIREAFRILENERLVVNIPRKGSFVAKISKENLKNVYQAREMIECFAIDLLAAKNKKDLTEIRMAINNVTPIIPGINSKDILDYLMSTVQFHIKLVESSGNDLIIHFYRAITSNLARYQYISGSLPGLIKDSHEEHQKIYDLLINGEYGEAKYVLTMHIRHFVDLLKEVVPS
jgi:DNA-binding GntR family transcriptional regulator